MILRIMAVVFILSVCQADAESAGTVHTVSPDGPLKSISRALETAAKGDTIRVLPGEYREHIIVDKTLTLIGQEYPVIDGEGRGIVVQIKAPGTVLRGFRITGSGESLNLEDAGLVLDSAPGSVIENNRLDDVLFGIYLKNSPDGVIRGNFVNGKQLPLPKRGTA